MRKVSRTTLAQKIINSKGRFFGITWYGKDGKIRKANAQFTNKKRNDTPDRNQDKIFGLLTVKSPTTHRHSRIVVSTLRSLTIDHQEYAIK